MEERVIEEQNKYDVVWREIPSYREFSPGELFFPFFVSGFQQKMASGQSLIDFGCGTARIAKEMMARGLKVTLVDISPYCLDEEIRRLLPLFPSQIHFVQACLWQLPEELVKADWIYCCDVLEHLPPDLIDEVLSQMAQRMRFGGYFSICLKEDLTGKQRGQPLHLTVREKGWWEGRIQKYFHIVGEDAVADELYFNCRVSKR